MSNFYSPEFPELPQAVQNTNFVIYYVKDIDQYKITYDKKVFIDRENNKLVLDSNSLQNQGYYYRDSVNDWQYTSQLGFNLSLDDNITLIASNYDILSYSNNQKLGQPYIGFFATSSPVTSAFSLSSGTITSNALSSIVSLIPIISVALIALFAFRKAWRFVIGSLKGA